MLLNKYKSNLILNRYKNKQKKDNYKKIDIFINLNINHYYLSEKI